MNFEPGTFFGLEDREIELFRVHLARVEGLGLEIGCCDGFSTCHILEFSKLRRLISVDPLVPDRVEKHLIGDEARLLKNIEPWKERHMFCKATSQVFMSQWTGEQFDFIFIDGDHSRNAAALDVCMCAPALKAGGLLAMHDCRMGRPGGARFHPGPSMVADAMIFSRPDRWEIVGEAYSLLIARKL